MTGKVQIPRVFFNASVVLAGLSSLQGGSAKLLNWVKQKKIEGIISEIIFDEATRHADRIKSVKPKVEQQIVAIFSRVFPAPSKSTITKYQNLVLDYGDIHLLASCFELKAQYLVTLDKKHLLSIKQKVKEVKIVSPKELIEVLSFK